MVVLWFHWGLYIPGARSEESDGIVTPSRSHHLQLRSSVKCLGNASGYDRLMCSYCQLALWSNTSNFYHAGRLQAVRKDLQLLSKTSEIACRKHVGTRLAMKPLRSRSRTSISTRLHPEKGLRLFSINFTIYRAIGGCLSVK